VTTDLFYDPREGVAERWRDEGAEAVEMEAAAVLATAARKGVPAACLLAVTDDVSDGRVRMDDDRIEEVGLELGRAALRALASR
jgi:5'-methylthioadenosine phosphorylase/purine-nucleoside phosphorylase